MRLASFLATAVGLGLAACSPSSFTTEVKGETTVPAGPPGVDTVLNAFPAIGSYVALDFNENQDFKNQGVTKDEVTSVHVKSLTLKVLSPGDADFRFLDSLEFIARAGDREERFARRDDISKLEDLRAPNPVLSLRTEDTDLRPYVAAPTMSIIVRGKGRLPEKEVRLQATVGLDVEVDLL